MVGLSLPGGRGLDQGRHSRVWGGRRAVVFSTSVTRYLVYELDFLIRC